jgi:hypothetical protein
MDIVTRMCRGNEYSHRRPPIISQVYVGGYTFARPVKRPVSFFCKSRHFLHVQISEKLGRRESTVLKYVVATRFIDCVYALFTERERMHPFFFHHHHLHSIEKKEKTHTFQISSPSFSS